MNLARRCSIISRASEGKSGSASGTMVSFGGGSVPPSGSGGGGGGSGDNGDGSSNNDEEGPVLSYKEVSLMHFLHGHHPDGVTSGALLRRTCTMRTGTGICFFAAHS